jgi:glycosyltransferase involved in cell wall biosynthesis
VVTRIEGYEELLTGADCATFVKAGDAVDLASAITTLLGDADARRTLGARGAAFAREYDWMPLARRLESIYAHVMSARVDTRQSMATSG